MAETPLEIQVDCDVHVPSGASSRKAVDAIRRQLRQHARQSHRLLSLIETREGRHRLPQALLPRVTETFRRYGIPYAVVDRRAMVSCPALRSRFSLSAAEEQALRQLLLRDSGVLVAASEDSRRKLAVELVARRQQRTLVVTESIAAAKRWVEHFAEGLDLPAPHVSPLAGVTPDTWVVVGRYENLVHVSEPSLRQDFGMVICDDLSAVNALVLMRTVRAAGARYLLGLAADPVRPDGLHDTLFLALGGVVHRMAQVRAAAGLRLSLRTRATGFTFPGYQGKRQYQALVAALAADRARCEQIVADVVPEARAGHACLVLSERRDHLELLAELLPPEISHETITSGVGPAERQRILSRFERGELAVLLATSQLAEESLATPRVQRLYLTFPFSYGRKLEKVVRALLAPAPGQEQAILFDYDDQNVDPLHRAFQKRAKFLGKLRRETAEQAQLELPLAE